MAWELGGGFGHVARFAALAKGLRKESRVYLALRDVTLAGLVEAGDGVSVLQAPLWLPEAIGLPEAASYPELLFRAGFLDPDRLAPVARAWRALFDFARPDLLLVDHAPTALLAARGAAMRRAIIGTGFFCPPLISPLPAFRTWEKQPQGRLEQAEAIALASANRVLDALGAPPLPRLADLFDVDENFLTTWPELDHYSQRPAGTRYWGPEGLLHEGAAAAWPQGAQARVFAYLQSGFAQTPTVLEALAAAPVRTLAYARGLAPATRARFESARLAISAEPVRIDQACAEADLLVSNAGSGTVCAFLQAGKPVILMPTHAEQYLFAMRVAQTGAGVLLDAPAVRHRLPKLVREMTGDSPERRAAQALAQRHAGCDIAGTIDRVVARCRELVGGEAGRSEPQPS